jgi:hypothetical protein
MAFLKRQSVVSLEHGDLILLMRSVAYDHAIELKAKGSNRLRVNGGKPTGTSLAFSHTTHGDCRGGN